MFTEIEQGDLKIAKTRRKFFERFTAFDKAKV